jgi:segregation and condensation protein B
MPGASPPADNADAWLEDDLEAAYQRALEATDELSGETVLPESGEPSDELDPPVERLTASTATINPDGESVASSALGETGSTAAPPSAPRANAIVRVESAPPPSADAASNVQPVQVIEAALFVDGPITTRRLCALLGNGFDAAFVECAVDQLNAGYAAEGRPFEIRLADGGYRLQLRAEFESLRRAVYGVGPRVVRLNQEVLEVLAVVAYRQPVDAETIESLRNSSPAAALRQLLRRELISLERDPANSKKVLYRTTPRFLALFGLGSLDELPRPDDIDIR